MQPAPGFCVTGWPDQAPQFCSFRVLSSTYQSGDDDEMFLVYRSQTSDQLINLTLKLQTAFRDRQFCMHCSAKVPLARPTAEGNDQVNVPFILMPLSRLLLINCKMQSSCKTHGANRSIMVDCDVDRLSHNSPRLDIPPE